MTTEWRPWEPGDPVRILVYGASKVGKTFGAGTFPRPCFMDFDRGLSTLYAPDFIRKHGVRTFQHRQFSEAKYKRAIPLTHNAYDDACNYFDEMMLPGKIETFDTWVIDSATTLGEKAQNKAVILLGTKEYGEMSHTHKQALTHNLLVPKIQDYGAERSLVEQFVDMLLNSDKNIVLICHEKERRDKDGNLIGLSPLLTGKSDEAVSLRFDELYNIQTKRQGMDWLHVCKTQPDGVRKLGSRNGVPDDTLWEYDAILAALTANYEERKRLAVQAASDNAEASEAAGTPATVESGQGG